MKVGDLVKAIYLSADSSLLGVIVAKVDTIEGTEVFKILWTNGAVSDRMWDHDLYKVAA